MKHWLDKSSLSTNPLPQNHPQQNQSRHLAQSVGIGIGNDPEKFNIDKVNKELPGFKSW